jgi:hypothetical protein
MIQKAACGHVGAERHATQPGQPKPDSHALPTRALPCFSQLRLGQSRLGMFCRQARGDVSERWGHADGRNVLFGSER